MAANKPIEPWFKDELAQGMRGLEQLGLRFGPRAHEVRDRIEAWAAILWPGRRWVEYRDVPRIRTAFRVLAMHQSDFPTPSEFLAALPPLREETGQEMLPPPRAGEVREDYRRRIRNLTRIATGEDKPAAIHHRDRRDLERHNRLRRALGRPEAADMDEMRSQQEEAARRIAEAERIEEGGQ